MYHAFAGLKSSDQRFLYGLTERANNEKSDQILRSYALTSGKRAFDAVVESAPKFASDPEIASKAFLENFTNEKDAKKAIDFYKKSNRIGYNNMAFPLQKVFQESY